MKPPCILFLLDWAPIYWSTREEFYASLSRELRAKGIKAVLTVSANIEERVRVRLEEAGAEVNPVPYAARYWAYASYIRGIRRRYHVLLAHIRFFDYFSLIPWLCRLNGIRQILFTEANSGEPTPRAGWKTMLVRLRTALTTLPLVKAVAISEFIRQRLLQVGVPAHKTCVIYNGIDTAAFTPDPGQRLSPAIQALAPNGTFLVTYLSALLPWKRPELLLEVSRLLAQRGAPVKILAAGAGPLRDSLEQQTQALGLSPYLQWIGHYPEPHRLLQASDAFLHTSLGEAFGNVLAEAMACAVPVVATRSGGTPELVLPDHCGILVDPGPAEAGGLAEAILRLSGDPPLCGQLGTNGCQRARREFTIQHAVEANLHLYQELLGNH